VLPGEELAGLGHDDGVNFANATERQKGITVNTWAEDLTSLDIVNEAIDGNSTNFHQRRRLPRQRHGPSGSVNGQGILARAHYVRNGHLH
jgi:hypothetical protein